MSSINFTKAELAAAIARGVRQYVFIGSGPLVCEALNTSPNPGLQVFAVDEEQAPVSEAKFVRTEFASEPLAAALEKSDFDRLKASLFVWLGGVGYHTAETVMQSLGFIASLPRGSGVLFDYAVERPCLGAWTHTALDALASRICEAGGTVKHLIQPQAVAAMLRGMGFQTVVDKAQLAECSEHLVSATL